ncbi:MAG: beta-ketoacyl synthase N-terminal-like domain-containing protein, partial [Caldilineaceae bacterium]
MSTDAFIFNTLRTPRGKGRESGRLHGVPPVRLLAGLLQTLEQRTGLDTAQVDDLVIGCVTPVGEQGANIARTAALLAGWHIDTPGVQVNRFCASGLEAVNLAAAKVRAGWEALVVAGGVESMSRVPIGSDGGALMEDPAVTAAIGFVPQGISADLIATLEGFGREDLDRYALQSQYRAIVAQRDGHFRSIVPVRDGSGALL